MARKAYILDTNIFMGSPDAIYGFEEEECVRSELSAEASRLLK